MTTTDHRDRGSRAAASGRKEQKAWYWYDWANSAFYTTVLTVLFAPYMIEVAGKAAGCTESTRENDCAKTVSLWVPRPRGRVAAVLPDQLRDDLQRVPPAGRRRDGRPVAAQEGAHGRLRLGRCVLLRAAVLHEGRELAARRGLHRRWPACSPAARWSATRRSCATSPPRRSATTSRRAAGPSATSAAACCWWSTSASCSATTPSGSSTGMAVRISLLSAALWWAGFTIIPFVRLRNRPPVNVGRRSPAACCSAASASCSPRSRTCATTR